MYRIVLKDETALVNNYLSENDFMTNVGKLMASYLNAPAWEYTYYGSKKVWLKVKADSDTHRFLRKYSQGRMLDKLLCGKIDEQLEIVKDVYEGLPDDRHPINIDNDRFNNKTARITDCLKRTANDSAHPLDDFNLILRHIFEDQLYEGKDAQIVHLDKDKFVARLGLRVCPYCGRNYIYDIKPTRDRKIVTVKPQIDHLMPKSVYPFLAVNFFNLIPSCASCNMKPAKGEQDTVENREQGKLRIMHPYLFDDRNLTFTYDPKSEQPMKPEELDVSVDYHGNALYKTWYNKLFFIDELYKYHNLEAHDIYMRMKTWKSEGARIHYKALGIDDEQWRLLPHLFFGYPFSDGIAPLRPLYKFTHDIYSQMLEDFEAGRLK